MQSFNNNRNCDFSRDIVPYLYDEINSREKSAFQNHLADCSVCADELAEFSEVHHAVENWREAEFAHLSLPEIVIPYHESPIKRQFVNEIKTSRFEGWRQIFEFGFAFKTAAATAVLIIFGAAVLLTLKFNGSDEIAAADLSPVVGQPAIIAPFDSSVQSAPTEVSKEFLPIKNAAVKNVKTFPAVARQSNVAVKNPVKVVQAAVKIPKQLIVRSPINQTVAVNSPNSSKSPVLNVEDEDIKDDSLRLSELFDETDNIN